MKHLAMQIQSFLNIMTTQSLSQSAAMSSKQLHIGHGNGIQLTKIVDAKLKEYETTTTKKNFQKERSDALPIRQIKAAV